MSTAADHAETNSNDTARNLSATDDAATNGTATDHHEVQLHARLDRSTLPC
jgi:hypothetical protein